MNITSFFRLPIIAFIITFGLLFLQLTLKINDIEAQAINYHYSPDFMRILGIGLFTMLAMSMALYRIHLYTVNLRNIIFIFVTVLLALLLSYWLEFYVIDFFATVLNLQQTAGQKIFIFWGPLLSRMLIIFVIYMVISIMTYFVKHQLKWQDENCATDLTMSDVIKKIQIIYFMSLYLAVNFIFQRYLYASVYIFFGGQDFPEFQNFSFYISALMTAILLILSMNNKIIDNVVIDTVLVVKVTVLLILSQLLISIIIALVTIYSIQYYFVITSPTDVIVLYTHYNNLIHCMLNSIFVVTILTCLLSYCAGAFWLRRYHYLVRIV